MVPLPTLTIPGDPVPPVDDPMVIGIIARPVGIHGEVKINKTTNGCPACLLSLREKIVIRLRDEFRELKLTHTSPTGNWIRFKFADVESPEHADLLRGAEIVIPSSEKPEKGADEYYVDDLTGCQVVADDDTDLGFLQEVWHQEHHDVWVVDGMYGEILVPAVKEFVLNVDVKNHVIVIKRVDGLWEENP